MSLKGIYNDCYSLALQTVTSGTRVDLMAVLLADSNAPACIKGGPSTQAWEIGIENNPVRHGGATVAAAGPGVVLEAGTKLFLDKTGGPFWVVATGSDAVVALNVWYN